MRFILMLLMIANLASCGFEIVDTGRRGILVNMGKIDGEPLPEGIHFYNPLTSDIVEINIRESAHPFQLSAYSKDNQTIGIGVTVVAKPIAKEVGEIFKEYGEDYFEEIASKEIIGGVKDIVGQMTASDIVSKRELLRTQTEKYLKEKLLALQYRDWETDRKSTRLNSSHSAKSRMPSSA